MADVGIITGGCNCGSIRYALAGPPLAVVACHCMSCRRQSGAAYSVNLVVRASTMTVEGELARWIDPNTESGEPLAREFCHACGSPIRSVPASTPKMLAVKAGTLDNPGDFAPVMHIWTASKLPWVAIADGLPQYARGPQT